MNTEVEELALELLNFLNATGNYSNFIAWAEERGYDAEELESDLEKLEEL